MEKKFFNGIIRLIFFSAICVMAACSNPSSQEDANKQKESPEVAPAGTAIFSSDSIPVFYMGRQELYNQIRMTAPKGKFRQMNIVLVYLYDPKTAGLGLNAWYFASNGNNRFDVSKVPAFLPKPGRKSKIKLNDSTYLSLNILYAKPWGGTGNPSQVNNLVTNLEKLDPKYQWIVFTPVIKSNYGKNFLCWKIIAEEAEPNAFVPGPLSFEDLFIDFNPSPPYGLGEQ